MSFACGGRSSDGIKQTGIRQAESHFHHPHPPHKPPAPQRGHPTITRGFLCRFGAQHQHFIEWPAFADIFLVPSLSVYNSDWCFPSMATSLPLWRYFSAISATLPQATRLCHCVSFTFSPVDDRKNLIPLLQKKRASFLPASVLLIGRCPECLDQLHLCFLMRS